MSIKPHNGVFCLWEWLALLLILAAIVHVPTSIADDSLELPAKSGNSTPLGEPPEDPKSYIGKTINVHTADLLEPDFKQSPQIFEWSFWNQGCAQRSMEPKTKDNFSFFVDIYAFMNMIGRLTTKAKFSFWGLKTSLFGETYSKTTLAAGSTSSLFINSLEYAYTYYLFKTSKYCLGVNLHLTNDFWSAFKKLPANMGTPELDASVIDSWRPYEEFVDKWGTHIVSEVHFGSKIELWASALMGASLTVDQLLKFACHTGLGFFKAMGQCKAFTEADLNAAASFQANGRFICTGGTMESREQFRTVKDPISFGLFMASGKLGTTPVGFEYTPLWEVLEPYVVVSKEAEDDLARVKTLQTYYEAVVGLMCVNTQPQPGPSIKGMYLSPVAGHRGEFVCTRPCSGCASESQCSGSCKVKGMPNKALCLNCNLYNDCGVIAGYTANKAAEEGDDCLKTLSWGCTLHPKGGLAGEENKDKVSCELPDGDPRCREHGPIPGSGVSFRGVDVYSTSRGWLGGEAKCDIHFASGPQRVGLPSFQRNFTYRGDAEAQ
eukprot:jgi/Botrbrau1/127/Bobra.0022s0113.1